MAGRRSGGEKKMKKKAYAAELLYLNDYKFSEKWSMMNMFGFKNTAIGKSGEFIGLLNNTLFYSFSKRFSVGVELNSEIWGQKWRYRLTPQAQYSFGKNAMIQIGGGPSQLNEEHKTDWLLTSRLIYDF